MGRQNPNSPKTVYRLSLLENDTHKPIRSVRMTRAGFIYVIISLILCVCLLAYCLVAFTPLRSTIPGYPDSRSKRAAVTNAIKIDSLERIIGVWELYSDNLAKVLTGEQPPRHDSIAGLKSNNFISGKSEEELARGDSLLRNFIREEEKFGVSKSGERSLPIEGIHFFTPCKGVIANGFDAVSHKAVDISSPAGSIVGAVLDGTVVYAGWNEDEGYAVVLQHRDNVVSIYTNCQKGRVNVGDEVKAGTPIALVGTALDENVKDHLHFELWHQGHVLDPEKYISF